MKSDLKYLSLLRLNFQLFRTILWIDNDTMHE